MLAPYARFEKAWSRLSVATAVPPVTPIPEAANLITSPRRCPGRPQLSASCSGRRREPRHLRPRGGHRRKGDRRRCRDNRQLHHRRLPSANGFLRPPRKSPSVMHFLSLPGYRDRVGVLDVFWMDLEVLTLFCKWTAAKAARIPRNQ